MTSLIVFAEKGLDGCFSQKKRLNRYQVTFSFADKGKKSIRSFKKAVCSIWQLLSLSFSKCQFNLHTHGYTELLVLFA